MQASVRTVLRMRALEGREVEFEAAWRAAAAEISRVPGNVSQELARDMNDPRWFVINSDWTDRAAVDAFGRSNARETLTTALRDLRDDAARNTYELLVTVPAVKALPVRIDLTTSVGPGEEEAFERAYEVVTKRLVGTPGLIREELLKEPGSNVYHIFAEWETERDFINWVEDPSHAEQSGPLVRWLSVDFARRLYEIRFRPPQNIATPGTSEFGTVARLASAPVPVPDSSAAAVSSPAAVSVPAPIQSAAAVSALPSPAPDQTVVLDDDVVVLDDETLVVADETLAVADESPAVVSEPLAASEPAVVVAPATLPTVRLVPVAGTPVGNGPVEVLVAGAGPAGLTHAIELARRGIAVRVIDKSPHAASQADKAIGIHCRTMEIWEDQGIVDEAMDAGIWLHGQTVFVNGKKTHQVDWAGMTELPYAHLGLPQYETERILTDKLASFGVAIERGVELVSFVQDDGGVTATVRRAAADGSAEETIRAQYLVGCDGAHSVVRSSLGLVFEGGLSMFPQLFMLGDVDLDWDMPEGHLLRFVRIEEDGDFTGMLVCVPLKGFGRYRVATLAPHALQMTIGSGVVEAGFWQEYTPPALADIQAVLDDLAPAGTTASNLRWSSIFRIKHGIVDRYRDNRVFVAGDAAHLHPPAGGQGMNTGIQDAWNLGWKLALAVRGLAAPGLLDSYQAERRPAGKAVVDRAVAVAFTDEMDMEDEKQQFLLEMQMTMNYAGSPLVGEDSEGNSLVDGPAPGHRAPDVEGLTRFGVAHPIRLFELIRGTRSTLLVYADASVGTDEILDLEKLVAVVRQQTAGQVQAFLLAAPGVTVPPLMDLTVLSDAQGQFQAAYGVSGLSAYLIRPDGHVGYRTGALSPAGLAQHLRLTFSDA